MDALSKKKLSKFFKDIAKSIDRGMCDNMTTDQFQSMIELIKTLETINLQKEKKPIWKIFG
jgi:hypothetical protein